ncbi:hypothetical protein Ciccas_004055 [Cichlidogyrus casuarinus]|uniref:Rab-GAP TBC domain-containing protein n=1 Tax=Cichlidogyrus casuarinus TaxID=1844966 RepID=A0ABD2QCR0_9PLAT
MLKNWNRWETQKKRETLIIRGRKGIPDSFRGEAWQKLCKSPASSICKPEDVLLKERFSKKQRGFFSKRMDKAPSTLSLQVDGNHRKGFSFSNLSRKVSMSISNGNHIKTSNIASAHSSLVIKVPNGNKRPTNLPNHDSNLSDPNLNTSSASSGYHSKVHPSLPKTIQLSLSPVHLDNEPFLNALDTPKTGSLSSTKKTTDCSFPSSSLNSCCEDNSTSDLRPKKNSLFDPDTLDSDLKSNLSSSKLSCENSASVSTASCLNEFGRVSTLIPNKDPAFIDDPQEQYLLYKSERIDDANKEQIDKDINRQFPHHELFSQKQFGGQETLRDMLRAYVAKYPDDGYSQGQAPLAAVLLMYMPEMNAFWVLDRVCQKYLPNYYGLSMDNIQIDGLVLFALLKRVNSKVHKFLVKRDVTPPLVMLEWFMCIFIRTLPWSCVLRVLDMFFMEGNSALNSSCPYSASTAPKLICNFFLGKIVLFKVGLVLLLRCFVRSHDRKNCPDFDSVMTRLSSYPKTIPDVTAFVHDVLECPINHRMVANEVKKQSKKFNKEMNSRT